MQRSHTINYNCCQVDVRTTSCLQILLTILLLTNIVDTIFDKYFTNSNHCKVDAENDKLLTDITFILTMRRKTLFYTVSLRDKCKAYYYLDIYLGIYYHLSIFIILVKIHFFDQNLSGKASCQCSVLKREVRQKKFIGP